MNSPATSTKPIIKNKPIISQSEFARRRKKLTSMMGSNSIAIISSSQMQIRNRDVEFPFRQDSNFLYLTGFSEPESIAVLIPNRKEGEFVLFCREKDPHIERWNGRMIGIDGAINDYQADDAFPIDDVDDILLGLMENKNKVYYNLGGSKSFDQQVISWINQLKEKGRKGISAPHEVVSIDVLLNELRLFKSPAEQKMMKFSAQTAVAAHERAMKTCKTLQTESQIEAEYIYQFTMDGMQPAYTTIAGCGENACILHYTENNQPLVDGELVLIDAGAEYQGYASDITRTFPTNGKFSKEQAALYQIVLDAQYAAIAEAIPGNDWNKPHEAAVRALTQGLVDVGVLSGDVDKLIEKEAYRDYYMHKTGHWLGLDVHDVGDYKIDDVWRELEPGMVLTIEPGLYMSPSKKLDKKWWNIGIRIEDDVLITKKGNEVLTRALAKEISDIEALMN